VNINVTDVRSSNTNTYLKYYYHQNFIKGLDHLKKIGFV